LITAGVVNTGEIALMNYDEPVFRWDTFGISAYDAEWTDTEAGSVISNVNSKKFVRFDKYGIYGINEVGSIDGANWKPGEIKDINDNATFALTWEGLKVTGNNGTVARIGKYGSNIVDIGSINGNRITVDTDGNVTIQGNLSIGDGTSVEDVAQNAVDNLELGGRNLLVGITKKELWTCKNYTDGVAYQENNSTTENYIHFG
jgi:hypothetical protein